MPAPACKITVLGSGTSVGIPTIGCHCDVCMSTDPRDKRLRPSILLQYDGRNVVVDTTPDFRQQVLRAGIGRLDAILYTHAHADHILGLDDVRPFNFRQRESIPVYGTEDTLSAQDRARARLTGLTTRESEVLACLGIGMSNQQIGRRLYVSEATVKGHISRLLVKLGCANRTQAGLLARDAGLLPEVTD